MTQKPKDSIFVPTDLHLKMAEMIITVFIRECSVFKVCNPTLGVMSIASPCNSLKILFHFKDGGYVLTHFNRDKKKTYQHCLTLLTHSKTFL